MKEPNNSHHWCKYLSLPLADGEKSDAMKRTSRANKSRPFSATSGCIFTEPYGGEYD